MITRRQILLLALFPSSVLGEGQNENVLSSDLLTSLYVLADDAFAPNVYKVNIGNVILELFQKNIITQDGRINYEVLRTGKLIEYRGRFYTQSELSLYTVAASLTVQDSD